MFKPTRAQILQAWDDREEGRPLSKEMALYLDRLEQVEESNAQAAEESRRAVKAALKAELRSMGEALKAKFESEVRGNPRGHRVVMSPEWSQQHKRYWELKAKIDRM